MDLKNHHKAAMFLAICLIVLFMPGIGDYRWVGLIGFIYIGLPWYILAVKDTVVKKLNGNNSNKKEFKVYSPTLLIFGIIAVFLGVAIDLFILYFLITEPSTSHFLAGATRLLTGIPIFGFGAYLIYLSLGFQKN